MWIGIRRLMANRNSACATWHLPELDFIPNSMNTNQPPRISIAIPSFNQGQYIEDTITSILDQNYPDVEIFVFDGGSTDSTVDVLTKYEKHLTFWVSEKDKGQTDA